MLVRTFLTESTGSLHILLNRAQQGGALANHVADDAADMAANMRSEMSRVTMFAAMIKLRDLIQVPGEQSHRRLRPPTPHNRRGCDDSLCCAFRRVVVLIAAGG
jgi:hypothetical protein